MLLWIIIIKKCHCTKQHCIWNVVCGFDRVCSKMIGLDWKKSKKNLLGWFQELNLGHGSKESVYVILQNKD